MAEVTGISWADATFNPWIGCQKVSPACDHCYAERLMDHRMGRVQWGAGQPRQRTSAANWKQPVRWNAAEFVQCAHCGWRGEYRNGGEHSIHPACANAFTPARRRVFCASLADVFDNEVDPAWRAELFALIAGTPNLDWLLLTKRIGNVAKMIEAPGMQKCGLPRNVWLGATVVTQEEADRDIPKLLAVPAAVRFLSIEPMLGPITLDRHLWACCGDMRPGNDHGLDWVICGGESGPGARPMHPDWVRSLRDQCAAAGVAFHFKQWGEWAPTIAAYPVKDSYRWPICSDQPGAVAYRIGTKAAGRQLDGRTHDGAPG